MGINGKYLLKYWQSKKQPEDKNLPRKSFPCPSLLANVRKNDSESGRRAHQTFKTGFLSKTHWSKRVR